MKVTINFMMITLGCYFSKYIFLWSENYLNSSPCDDSHEEVGNDACNSHHETLYHSDTCVEAQHEEDIMTESRMQMDHVIADGSRDKCNHYQEWHRGYSVADHKCNHPIVSIHSFSLKHLF